MIRIIIVLITVFLFNALTPLKSVAVITADSHCEILESLYKRSNFFNRNTILNEFFSRWEIQDDIRLSKLKNEYESSIFIAFEHYFEPKARLTELEIERIHKRIIKSTTKYFTVGSSLTYSIVDSLSIYLPFFEPEITGTQLINPFKPNLTFDKPILFLDNEFYEAVHCFVGSQSYSNYTSNPPAELTVREVRRRIKFLRRFIPVVRGHWGDYLHLETQPIITHAEINKNMSELLLHFRLGFTGGYALYVNKNNTWVFREHKIIWIE